MVDIQDRRKDFNENVAPALAEQVGARRQWVGESSSWFSYFTSKTRFVVGAAPRRVRVRILPCFRPHLSGRSPPDPHPSQGSRISYVAAFSLARPLARPHVYVHSAGRVAQTILPTKGDTIQEFENRFGCLSEELRDATAPAHLGRRSAAVTELVEWATCTTPWIRLTVGESERGSAWVRESCQSNGQGVESRSRRVSTIQKRGEAGTRPRARWRSTRWRPTPADQGRRKRRDQRAP